MTILPTFKWSDFWNEINCLVKVRLALLCYLLFSSLLFKCTFKRFILVCLKLFHPFCTLKKKMLEMVQNFKQLKQFYLFHCSISCISFDFVRFLKMEHVLLGIHSQVYKCNLPFLVPCSFSHL